MMRIRGSVVSSLRRYSYSPSVGFNKHELRRQAKKHGIELHFPEEGVQTKKRSLALLVGWAESRQKAMAKFAAIYTKEGIPCLSIAPGIHHMWFTSMGNKLTSHLITSLDMATPTGTADEPVNLVMHLFSGACYTVFPKLVEEVAKPDGLFNTKIKPGCIIFDSAPTLFCRESGIQAAKLVYKQGGFNYLTYSASRLVGVAVNAVREGRKCSDLASGLQSPLLAVPQLYLYSKADSVCRSEWVESVIMGQREKGRETESFRWEDSEHVQHFIKHPDEYENQVVQFLEKHLIGRKKPNSTTQS